MKNDRIKRGMLLVLLSLLGVEVQAQEGISPAELEQLKLEKLWSQTKNAAGSVYEDKRNYSNVTVSYNLENGDFHRPQQGGKEEHLNVGSEGFLNLKHAYVWGNFSFRQIHLNDAGYNASITDPFRGMPYYVADPHFSKWRNQDYNLKCRVGTPLYANKVTLGLEASYVASIAAKQRDPRVDTRFYTLELSPGITYAIHSRHRIGVYVHYASIKEDSRMSNINLYTDQEYYELYGLGVSVKGIGSGRTTNYFGTRWGGGLQYNCRWAGFDFLLDGGYAVKAERVEVSFSDPEKDAGIREQTAQIALNLHRRGDCFSYSLRAEYVHHHVDGIQYVSQRDNSQSQYGWIDLYHSIRSVYRRQSASVHYALIRNSGEAYDWKLEADLRYRHYDDKYLLPLTTKDAEQLSFGMGAKKNLNVGNRLSRRLLLAVRAGYTSGLSGDYHYGGPHPDYVTVEMERRDEQYLLSDFYKLGFSATYSRQLFSAGKAQLFVRVAFDYAKTTDFDFNHRSYTDVAVGFNF